MIFNWNEEKNKILKKERGILIYPSRKFIKKYVRLYTLR